MAFSWGEKAEIKEEILEGMAEERANIKAEKRINSENEAAFNSKWAVKEKQFSTTVQLFEAEKETYEKIKSIEARTKDTEDALDAAQRQLDEKELAIGKSDVLYRESQLDKFLSEKDRECAAKISVAQLEARKDGLLANIELSSRVEKSEAGSLAKDAIIANLKETIELLNETLKVTMGKLTQVDLKGVTIHVEAEKQKQEQK